jgi:hypothetical protein
MATAAAMAALRATALGDCGGGICNEDGCCNSRGKDNGNSGNGVGDNRPCCPCHCPLSHLQRLCQQNCLLPLPLPTLPPATSLPMPSPMLLLSPLHLSVCNEEGDGEGNKSNGNCNKECNGDDGKSNGDSNDANVNKEGKGKVGKRDGDGNAEGNGEDGKGDGKGSKGNGDGD